MDVTTVEIVRLVSIFSVLAPFSSYWIQYKKLPRESHIMGIVSIVEVLTGFVVFILPSMHGSTTIAYHAYFVFLFITLCLYYYQVVFKFKNRGYFYLGVALYLIAVFVIDTQRVLIIYQSEMWAVTGVILVFFGIIYNNYQVEKPPLFDKNLYSGLIFNGAIILYFSFNFFLFIIANYVLSEPSPDTNLMALTFHNINNIIRNVAFAFAFYYTGRRRVNLTDEEIKRIQWRHLQ